MPDAAGEPFGEIAGNGKNVRLLVIGESTVAGVGVEHISNALAARFGHHLHKATGVTVNWYSAGVSGITVRRAIREILPTLPDSEFDLIVVALGGNDVFALNSPMRFRADMEELIGLLRDRNPDAEMFLANVPMIRDAIALPNPLKFVLRKLAKMQHFNVIEMVSRIEGVYYYDDVRRVGEDFFSDGIHPSLTGYDDWAREMTECYLSRTGRFVGQ